MKETCTVRRKLKTLKAQTVMRDVESTIFATNCTWQYGTPFTMYAKDKIYDLEVSEVRSKILFNLFILDQVGY
jgi:hypothetical protein